MTRIASKVLMVCAALVVSANFALAQSMTSKPFAGAKVNGGTVTMRTVSGQRTLTLSDDFKVPDTPDPHWQVVDAQGRVFLLQRLGVKNLGGIAKDKINMTITLPAYVGEVAKVQIYCAWAETVLGETSLMGRATN